jgi:hypothetical protein
LLFTGIATNRLLAQSGYPVNGVVKDKVTKKVISGAVINVKGSNSAQSGEDGKFVMYANDPVKELVVSAPGYDMKKVSYHYDIIIMLTPSKKRR